MLDKDTKGTYVKIDERKCIYDTFLWEQYNFNVKDLLKFNLATLILSFMEIYVKLLKDRIRI